MILLDTHVLVWLSTEPTKLSKQASRAIRKASRSGTSPFPRLRCGNWPGLPVMPASCVPRRILGRQGSIATSKQSATLLYTSGQTRIFAASSILLRGARESSTAEKSGPRI